MAAKKITHKIEKFFEDYTRLIYRNPIKTLAFMFVVFLFFAIHVPDIIIDTSVEEMLQKDDPKRLEYNWFRDQFGKSELVMVMVKTPDIFDKDVLSKFKRLHGELEAEIPYLRAITSLVNIRNIRGVNDTVEIDALFKGLDTGRYTLKEFREIVLANTFYRDNIVSSDGKCLALIIENETFIPNAVDDNDDVTDFSDNEVDETEDVETHFLTPDENEEVDDAVNRVIQQYQADDFEISFTGGPVMVDVFNRATQKDLKKFIIMNTFVIMFFLILLFRRFSGVFIPFIIVELALISTLGIMVMFDRPITMMTTILPSFICAVGIADAIHVLAIFYRKYDEGATKEEAICFAMGHSGFAIAMTSLTTAAGLLSFSFAEILTIAEMGVFASIGVTLAFLYTIILLPAVISLIPVKVCKKSLSANTNGIMDRILLFFASISTTHPVKIVIGSIIIFVISIGCMLKLGFSSNIVNYFPVKHPARIALKTVEQYFKGTISVEIVIDTKKENGIQAPDILKSIEKLSLEISKIQNEDIFVGKVFSIVDIVKETNQALHGNNKDYYKIPENADTVSQELLLFENTGSEDLEKIVDSLFQKTRVTIKTKWADSVIYETFADRVETLFKNEFQGRAETTVTGLVALLARTISAALVSMVESYIVAFIIITVMMLFLLGDLKLGLLSMCPNLLPIIMVMGLIGFSGLKLDINTLFIGSIAIGLVVDDTIHFMYNFKKFYDRTGDAVIAVNETLLGAGRAMLITSIVLSINFFILTSAQLNHTTRFGFFTGMVIVLALLADFVLAPALMMLASGDKTVTITQSDPA